MHAGSTAAGRQQSVNDAAARHLCTAWLSLSVSRRFALLSDAALAHIQRGGDYGTRSRRQRALAASLQPPARHGNGLLQRQRAEV